MWDFAGDPSLALRANIRGHTGAISDLKFFEDSDTFYSASADKTVRAWNTADGTPLWKLVLPEPVRAMTIGRDKPFQSVNDADGEQVKQNKRMANAQSRVIVSAGAGNDLSVWRMPDRLGEGEAPAEPLRGT